MSSSAIKSFLPALRGAAFAAALASASAAQGQQSGPFGSLAGSWSGAGRIAISNGVNERIRCRAQYQVGSNGAAVRLELRCASDSYKFELQGNVNYQNGEVVGNWNETTRNVAGRVTGSVNGNQIDVRVDGQTFAALLSLTTRGDRQSISITAPVGSEMSEATITLDRGS
jgi:hypothetical protein